MDQIIEWFIAYGGIGLALVSFMESSFFPIPPDFLLIPLGLADPSRALWYGIITTIASVFGALFGYFLGARFGRGILLRFTNPAMMEKVDALFAKYGGWAVGIAAFTPIPYKVFTIASGVFRVRTLPFLVASVIGRGARFITMGWFLMVYGDQAALWIREYSAIWSMVVVAGALLLYLIWRRWNKRSIRA